MSGVNKCDRCGSIIEKREELHRLPDVDTANTDKDACEQCWKEFRWWWNNVLRPEK